MKTIIWLACFYALLIGTTLALPNGDVEARGNKKHPKKHPKHPKHPNHPNHPSHPTPTVTVKALASTITTTTTTTTLTTSTRSTVAAGPSFIAISKQLGGHSISRRELEQAAALQQKRDSTVTLTTATTTSTTTTTTTALATALSTLAPVYAQCGADNFVSKIDGNYVADIYSSSFSSTNSYPVGITNKEDCCIECQKTIGCVSFLYRDPVVPTSNGPVGKKREASTLASCKLLISQNIAICPAIYSAYGITPANAAEVGLTSVGNGNCGIINYFGLD